jgi:hypothetical protein
MRRNVRSYGVFTDFSDRESRAISRGWWRSASYHIYGRHFQSTLALGLNLHWNSKPTTSSPSIQVNSLRFSPGVQA